MNEDGSMARLDGLVSLAQRHGLRIGTIRDLIAYRRRHDHDVVKLSETSFDSAYGGEWRVVSYLNRAVGNRTVALLKGVIESGRPTLVRMHQLDFFRDTLGEIGGSSGLLRSAMETIAEDGSGVVVIINQSDADALSKTVETHRSSDRESEAAALRDYGIGAQILSELGVHEMILLTNTAHAPVALAGYGLSIVDQRPLAVGRTVAEASS